jgi:hypothetical protein
MKYFAVIEQTKEMDLEFPYYTKDGSVMYAIVSPYKTIAIYTNSNSIDTFLSILGVEYEEIRESEYINAFDKVMNNILTDLKR